MNSQQILRNSEDASVISDSSSNRIDNLIGENWDYLSSGFYCLKLIGDIFRCDDILNPNYSFDDRSVYSTTSSLNQFPLGTNDNLENSIYYHQVYEISRELLECYVAKSTEIISSYIQFIYREQKIDESFELILELYDNVFKSVTVLLDNVIICFPHKGYSSTSFKNSTKQITSSVHLFIRTSTVFLQLVAKFGHFDSSTVNKQQVISILIKLVKSNYNFSNLTLSQDKDSYEPSINNSKSICNTVDTFLTKGILFKHEASTISIVELILKTFQLRQQNYLSQLQPFPVLELDRESLYEESLMANLDVDNANFINEIISRYNDNFDLDNTNQNKVVVKLPYSPMSAFSTTSFFPRSPQPNDSSPRRIGCFGGESTLRYVSQTKQAFDLGKVTITTLLKIGTFTKALQLFGEMISQTGNSLYKGKFNDPIFVQVIY